MIGPSLERFSLATLALFSGALLLHPGQPRK